MDEEIISLFETPDVAFGVSVPDEVHPSARAQKKGTTYRTIAFINEYGDDERGIPERPVFGPAMEKNLSEYMGEISSILRGATKGAGLEGPLQTLADKMADHVRDEIADYSHQTPLADSTVARKRQKGISPPDQPWVEEGDLRKALYGDVRIEAKGFDTKARRFRDALGRFKKLGL
jgi:hypothetical protein